MDEIIAKLLAKEPDDRFQTAKEVADLLARCQSELQLNGQVTCIASSRPKSSPHAPREESRTSTDANRASDIAPPTTSSARSAYFTWNVKATFAAVIGLAVIVGLIIKPWHNEPRKMAAPGRPSGTLSNAKKTAEGGHPTSPTSWHGWPADAPPPAMAPFDAEQAQHHQEAWAKYLGVPVEYTNSLGMKFRLIPPGEFMMGSTVVEIEEVLKLIAPNWEHERECLKSESPQQPVVLTQPIYFSVHEVTQKQYQVVMGVNPAAVASTSGDQTFVEKMRGIDTSDFPVENISWNDATEFSKKLNLLEKLKLSVHRLGDPSTILDGSEYRLPTEAEWEFACRSGSVGPNWLGRNSAAVLDQIGWYIDNSEARTHAAGAKKSNPFGLFDMHGNVWEWCLDLWQSREQKLLSNDRVVNPNIQTSESLQRIIRGGNWCGWGFQCGASARSKVDPNQRVGAQAGIRLTLSAEAVKDFLTRELSLVTGPAIPRSTRTGAKLSVVESLTSPDYEWTEPEDLGPVVNFAAYNYCPRVTNDGLEMWFVGNGGKGSKGEDDVWVSRRKSLNHSWEVPINAGEPINTTAKEKDFSLTGDGLSVFFRSWARDGISVSKRTGRDQPWSTLEVIPSLNGNDAAKDANNPVVSPDGLTLFVALPPEAGGPGGSNIAVVTRKTASDPWSLPTIFPEPLNSPGEDLPCWLSADGRLMLLSSKRDGGMGDSDLWMATRKTDATEWQPPVNLGKGINTEHGEFAGHLALDGQTLWFSRHVPQGQYRYQVIWQSRRVPKKRVATLPIELEDRDIAEEILRRGGIVVVNTESEELEIKQLAQLPARPMTLIGVNCETIRSSTDANLVRLLSQARHLRHVNLGSSSLTDEQTTFLENLPNLEVVILWNNPKITKTTADRMRGLTKLRGIALNSTTLGPGGLDGLRGAVLLEELRVLDCRLGDEDLEIVKNLPNLQVLEVGANPLTSRSLETFRGLRDLRHLDIHRLKITDDDLVQLTGFPKLELLDLSSTQVSDLGLRRVATITGLRVLNLSGTSITGEGLPHLKELKQLTELVIVNGVVNDAGLQQLPDLPRLHKLSLVRNPISSQSLKALDRVPNLEMLALDGTRVDDAAMEHIARLARLKTLYLARTQITDAGLMKLKSLGQLQSLNVRSTKVTKEGVTALKELCPQCRIESDHGTFEP